ncbi:MAG: hypothetical protein GX591_20550 [Planctomycetes bacterium]|nr:hypothetical protein [Planctomycetota bacterium]
MAETRLTDAEADALAGTTDAATNYVYPTIGEEPWYTAELRRIAHLLEILGRAGDLRVYRDGDLTFGVSPGEFMNGDTAVAYAGTTEEDLTDDDVNYIYLTDAGVLVVNTTGFPTPSVTAHVPLAEIAVGTASAAGVSGTYAIADITDRRGRAMMTLLS